MWILLFRVKKRPRTSVYILIKKLKDHFTQNLNILQHRHCKAFILFFIAKNLLPKHFRNRFIFLLIASRLFPQLFDSQFVYTSLRGNYCRSNPARKLKEYSLQRKIILPIIN